MGKWARVRDKFKDGGHTGPILSNNAKIKTKVHVLKGDRMALAGPVDLSNVETEVDEDDPMNNGVLHII